MPYAATAKSQKHRGWFYDQLNGRLAALFNGTEVFDFDADDLAIAKATVITGGLQIASGTLNIDGIADFALDVKFNSTITAGADGVGADGEQLTSGGAAAECDWAAASSLTKFKNLLRKRSDEDGVLAEMVNTPVYDFRYKTKAEAGERVMSTGDHDTIYTGIVAEDAPWAMHYGGKILNPISAFGRTILALRALDKRLKAVEAA